MSQGSLDMIFPRDRLDPATYQSLDHRSVLGNLREFQTARSRRSSTSAGPMWQNTVETPTRETLELKLIILLDSLVTRQFKPLLLQPGQQIHCPYGHGGQVVAIGFNPPHLVLFGAFNILDVYFFPRKLEKSHTQNNEIPEKHIVMNS